MKLFSILILLLCSNSAYCELAWKTLIYMQADNDLAPYAMWDLREIAASTKSDGRSKTIIHLDLPGIDKLYEFEVLPDQTEIDTNLAQYKKSKLQDYKLKFLRTIDERSSKGQQEQLLDFLNFSNKNYPSKNTMLVIWGHGEGYGDGTQFGGVAIDQNPSGRLGIPQLEKVLANYYLLNNEKISIIAMDACLMQTIEVATALEAKSKYLVGSTQIQNFQGLPYHLINNYVENELEQEAFKSDSGEDYYLVKKIPALIAKYYENFEFKSETASSLSVTELENSFMPAFEKLFFEINLQLRRNPFWVFGLQKALGEVPFFLGQTKDISLMLAKLEEHFLGQGLVDFALLSASAQEALKYSIISYTYGTDYHGQADQYYLGSFKAFGIWLPNSKHQYELRIEKFRNSIAYSSKYFKSYRVFLETLFERSLL